MAILLTKEELELVHAIFTSPELRLPVSMAGIIKEIQDKLKGEMEIVNGGSN